MHDPDNLEFVVVSEPLGLHEAPRIELEDPTGCCCVVDWGEVPDRPRRAKTGGAEQKTTGLFGVRPPRLGQDVRHHSIGQSQHEVNASGFGSDGAPLAETTVCGPNGPP